MIIRDRLREHIPIIRCLTCGKVARQRSVIELESPTLISEKRKTWGALIKSSFNLYQAENSKRLNRNKRIFYAAMLQSCINRKHRLSVEHLADFNFRKSCADNIVEIKESRVGGRFNFLGKKRKKLVKGEYVHCASCGKKTSIYEVCMRCGRCSDCCYCKTKMKIKRDKLLKK